MGLSGERFAEFLEIPYGTLRDIEAGASSGRASTKIKIARKLKTTVEELDGPTKGELSVAADSSQSLLGAIVSLLPALNEPQLRNILSIAEGYSRNLSPSLPTRTTGK